MVDVVGGQGCLSQKPPHAGIRRKLSPRHMQGAIHFTDYDAMLWPKIRVTCPLRATNPRSLEH